MTRRRSEFTSKTATSARWQTYVASSIGADHVRAGTICQDAAATEAFGSRGSDGVTVFAVADGHGHARHFRSDRGSKLAVTAAIATARQWSDSVAGSAVTPAAASALVSAVVAQWRADVAADLAADPISEPQASALPPSDPPEIPYGSTLLLVVIVNDIAVLTQIGDGSILVIRPDGRSLAPVPDDISLDGTQTTSLCQPDAVSAFRVALVSLTKTPLFAIFAATDGFGNAQAREDWQASLGTDLVTLGLEHGVGWLGSQLSDWTAQCASSAGSGDDTSAAISFDTTAVLTKPAAPVLPEATLILGGTGERTVLGGGTSLRGRSELGGPLDQTLRLPAGPQAQAQQAQAQQAQAQRGQTQAMQVPAQHAQNSPPAGAYQAPHARQEQTARLRPPRQDSPPGGTPWDATQAAPHGPYGPASTGPGGAAPASAGRRLSATRGVLLLAAALIVVIALVFFLLHRSPGPSVQPGFSPSPSHAVSPSPGTSGSTSPSSATTGSPHHRKQASHTPARHAHSSPGQNAAAGQMKLNWSAPGHPRGSDRTHG